MFFVVLLGWAKNFNRLMYVKFSIVGLILDSYRFRHPFLSRIFIMNTCDDTCFTIYGRYCASAHEVSTSCNANHPQVGHVCYVGYCTNLRRAEYRPRRGNQNIWGKIGFSKYTICKIIFPLATSYYNSSDELMFNSWAGIRVSVCICIYRYINVARWRPNFCPLAQRQSF